MKNITKISLGVDVSKNFLDAHIYPFNKVFKVENTKKGVEYLIKIAQKNKVEVAACESSGGYENLFINLFLNKGFQVWQMDPKRVKAFIYSEGVNFKNDPNDAKMIALFAIKKNQEHESMLLSSSKKEKSLRETMKLRNNLKDDLARYKRMKSSPSTVYANEYLSAIIAFFETQIQELDAKVKEEIYKDPILKKKHEILMSTPGIGFVTSATLLVEMPELGKIENKPISALFGVAPYTKQSGQYKGKEKISGGRSRARRALYMAALSAMRCNPILSVFYKKLKEQGKASKVALVAVMRKLGVYSNAMLRKEEYWKVVN